jgi:hypothetical protein
MRSWRRLILCVRLAQTPEPARGFHALFKCCEPAICAARLTTVNRTPGIVLGFGACSNADDTDANSQHEQQEPHSRLLGWPLSYKCPLSRFIPYPCAMRRGGLRLTSPKLPELLSRHQTVRLPRVDPWAGLFCYKSECSPAVFRRLSIIRPAGDDDVLPAFRRCLLARAGLMRTGFAEARDY